MDSDFRCCEGRTRTYTRRLGTGQKVGGQPLHIKVLYPVFISNSPPPRQEGMAAKFHHLTILSIVCLKNFRLQI